MADRTPGQCAVFRWTTILLAVLLAPSCAGSDSGQPVLTAEMPLHLEEHLDAAIIDGSEVPEALVEPVEWRFDEPQPDWKPATPLTEGWQPVEPYQVDDALRLPLTEGNRSPDRQTQLAGTVYVELPDWRLEDWGYVEINARTRDPEFYLGLVFNYSVDDPLFPGWFPFYSVGDITPVVTDGTVQTYRISLDAPVQTMRGWGRPWTHLGILAVSMANEETAALDILSVRAIPREAEYAGNRAGVQTERLGASSGSAPFRRALYTHSPGRVVYQVRVPQDGRLDVGLGVLLRDTPVTFAITATQPNGEAETLLEEIYADREHWGQRSVDLSHLSGQKVTLALEADSERAGTVALWATPTLTGPRTTDNPNVVFYVIDGAGAEYMSVYGYNRQTTPNLERLAAEGAVFEWAYSNSDWTRPSNASFMTSLQHSVLGGYREGLNVVPENAPTMAQHLHRAGYQTAVFTPNPNAGRMSGLDRGVDIIQENWEEFTYAGGRGHNESSRYLNEAFWRWREAYPADPYWVHLQPVDIHEAFPAVAPFAGLYVGPEQVKTWRGWKDRLEQAHGDGIYSESWEETGISRIAFYSVMQGLYDEAMAHNDYQIGRLVERLKATGEWENTLLIVAADHSILSAMQDMGIAILDELPPLWNQDHPMFRPSISRIPLIFVWPGHIEGGQRFREPTVSMIDVLPTVLDLVGLPLPEIMQGQSLAPLLLAEGTWEPRPVILDEFEVVHETGELRGLIEVVDGRWGASLQINPNPERPPERQRPAPLLLYDLWNDPDRLHSLHEERPDLVEKYTLFLEAQFVAHKALATQFTPGAEVALTPEQLRTLRALGYIQ